MRSRAGLAASQRGSSFLFLGPTGVGKTELCKALAALLFDDEKAVVSILFEPFFGVFLVFFPFSTFFLTSSFSLFSHSSTDPHRLLRVHGEARRLSANRRSPRLHRPRAGRAAHRGRPPQALLGRSLRRDREGARRRLERAAAGARRREADGLAREDGQLRKHGKEKRREEKESGEGFFFFGRGRKQIRRRRKNSFFFTKKTQQQQKKTDDRPDLQHRRDHPPRPAPAPKGQEGRRAQRLPLPLQARAAQQARRDHRLRRSDPGDAPRRRADPGARARGEAARARGRAGVYGGGAGVGGVEVFRPELWGEFCCPVFFFFFFFFL